MSLRGRQASTKTSEGDKELHRASDPEGNYHRRITHGIQNCDGALTVLVKDSDGQEDLVSIMDAIVPGIRRHLRSSMKAQGNGIFATVSIMHISR